MSDSNEPGMPKDQGKNLLPRTKMFARRVIHLYCSLSKTDAVAQVLGRQALRSGTSVGANYREAHRGRSKAEFISKMGDCLKEAEETSYWLELLLDEKIVSRRKLGPLAAESNELVAIFVTIIKKAKGQS